MGKSRFSLVGLDSWSARFVNSFVSCFPSTASLMREIVLSILRRRVLGLVIVVPRLAWRACPRLKGDTIDPEPALPEVGVAGEIGCDDAAAGVRAAVGAIEPFVIAASIAALIPFGDGDPFPSSEGVAGDERWGATSSGSISSGGRRSFSISDLRL